MRSQLQSTNSAGSVFCGTTSLERVAQPVAAHASTAACTTWRRRREITAGAAASNYGSA